MSLVSSDLKDTITILLYNVTIVKQYYCVVVLAINPSLLGTSIAPKNYANQPRTA